MAPPFQRLQINWAIDWQGVSCPDEADSPVISWQVKQTYDQIQSAELVFFFFTFLLLF